MINSLALLGAHVAAVTAQSTFVKPFKLSSSGGSLWIEPLSDASARTKLHIKGAVWTGFQANGCPQELQKHTVQAYVAFLKQHRFNAVRLPLSAALVNANSPVGSSCGAYSGQATLSVLDDVLVKLRDAGIFALLDIQTLSVRASPFAKVGLLTH